MKIRLEPGVILNDERGVRLGDGNDPDACELEVDVELGQALLRGGSAVQIEPLKKSER